MGITTLIKTALMPRITGQGYRPHRGTSSLKGYEVHGFKRRGSSFNTDCIDHLSQDPHERGMRLHYGELTDATNLIRIVYQV
jgi:GDPmannose 4,6-dehydratase